MKKKIFLVVIIIAILFIIVGIILMNGSQSKKPEKQVIKKIDIDEEQVFKDEVIPKISSLDANLYDKYPIEDIDKLDNVTKTKFLLDILYSPSKEITVKQVENESKKYFTNYQIVKKDIKDGEVVAYKYENNKYIKGTTVGNRCTLKTSIISKKKVDSNYIVKSKYYYISGKKNSVEDLDATIKIFKSLEDCKQDKSEIFITTSKTIGITEEEYKSNEDKFATYTYEISKDYKIKSIKSE